MPSNRTFVLRWGLPIALSIVLASAGSSPASALSLAVGLDFTGTTFGSQSSSYPPDTMGAVGPDHIVEIVNGRYAVYRKSDGVRVQTSSLNQFWTSSGTAYSGSTFDPRILYDASSQRFFAVSTDNARAPNGYLVAVSASSDPTAGWSGFRIDSDASDTMWADFPTLGIDADAVIVGATMFALGSSATASSSSLVVIPKADLLAPLPTIARATSFENTLVGFQAQPVVDLDGGGLPALLISGTIAPLGLVMTNTISGTAAAPVLGPRTNLAVPPMLGPPAANQPGLKANLDSGDSRFGSNIVERDGRAWAVHGVEQNGHAAVRWMAFDAMTSELLDSGLITDPALDLFYPSIAINDRGDIVIGMSGSSETTFASSFAVLGQTAGGVTQFGSPILLEAGLADYQRLGSDGRNRFGDYSATVVDPSDPAVFWTFQEFVPSANVWGVRITQLFVVPEPGTLLLVAAGLVAMARQRRGNAAA